ncbi:hypothetical protein CVT25_007780 [Psilocybe cyanescens]|uniref:Uncharacterized protein n=1 Tax=Psilocybe cyanescens TaxID=93625 RepID=A0A409W9H9_PSICY|nr:hypothetical protein CVT25_007780 [Psilocybe cyanescens]
MNFKGAQGKAVEHVSGDAGGKKQDAERNYYDAGCEMGYAKAEAEGEPKEMLFRFVLFPLIVIFVRCGDSLSDSSFLVPRNQPQPAEHVTGRSVVDAVD